MEPFMAILKDFQDAIIESQHVPGVNTICDCGSGLPRLFRCTECADFGVSCKECVLASHSKNPFHVIERHTGNFFERCGLASIGMRTHLLHNLRCRNKCYSHDWYAEGSSMLLLLSWAPVESDATYQVIAFPSDHRRTANCIYVRDS